MRPRNLERPSQPSSAGIIMMAWLLCGVMDLTAACVTGALRSGVTPGRILQFVASGVLGPKAFSGGVPAMALGLAIHFTIALGAATAFYLASRKLEILLRNPFLSGALYGLTVYLFMAWVVMPLSAVRQGRYSMSSMAVAVITHILCVGMPIALVVSHANSLKLPAPQAQ